MIIENVHIESLVAKTYFLTISTSTFGNFRKTAVEAISNADPKRLKHQKQLLNSPELAAIQKSDAAVKLMIDADYSLPYDTGIRLIPRKSLQQVVAILKNYQNVQRPALVNAFFAAYLTQKDEAKNALGDQFVASNYPSLTALQEDFAFHYAIISFSVPGDLKEFDQEMFEEETAKAQVKIEHAVSELITGLRVGAFELVNHLAEQLSGQANADGKAKRLNKNSIANLTEFLNTFDIKNVTDDAALKEQMDRLKALMSGVDADKIRNSENLKTDLSAKFGEIAKTLSTMVEVKGRKFRDAPVAAPIP